MLNYKKIFAIKKEKEEIIKKCCPKATHTSGIYAFHRIDENGIKYGYVGLASKSLLTRLAEHLTGYQHIDLSIKKHGLYDDNKNPYGYKVDIVCFCPPSELDEKEPYYIKLMAEKGYQLRNTQSGSRTTGRYNINESRPARGYKDGVAYGKKKLAKDLKEIVDKYLIVSVKKEGKLAENALKKFYNLLNDCENDKTR